MIAGAVFFLFSFSEKQHSAMIENLGEKTAKNAHLLLRYGGPIMFLVGLIQLLLSDF
jgi:hypothetical protein